MTGKVFSAFSKVLGFSKKVEKEKDDIGSEPERLSKYDPSAISDFNKKMIDDYQRMQEEIFLRQREIALKPLEQQEEATKRLEKWINSKNKQFFKEYSGSFEKLTDENKKTLVGV
ncbi:hypothetical protein [Borreliella lusitaniae]|uniref:hypothetical protein n=1 Tax=Borreliella lusitaniae TaxID=100177 RepID=UPI003C737715